MRRDLSEHWVLSVLCGPIAVVISGLALAWSPWAAALALALPAVLLSFSAAGATLVASYALGAAAGASVLVVSGVTNLAERPSPFVLGVAMLACALTSGASHAFSRKRLARWSALTLLGVTLSGGLLALTLAESAAILPGSETVPPAEMLAAVPACPTRCDETATPAGHLRCSSVTRTDRVVAERECQEATGFLHVRAGERQTSVLVRRDERAMIWIDSKGRLSLEQEGRAVRGLSSEGAVLLTSLSAGGMPAAPAHVLRVCGGLLWLVGLALLRVLFSLRRERVLSRGVAGHVEQGRFFPHDSHLASVAVDDTGDLGPALLLGDARSVGYRSGGGQPAKVVRGSAEELLAALHAKRLMAYALSLSAVSFALVGIASDLSRLH